jgi:hypothetical protein
MKYLKMLGLAAVAAMAVMAFVGAGSASADEICTDTVVGGDCAKPITSVHGVLVAGTSAKLTTTEGTTLDTCTTSTIQIEPIKQGTGNKTIEGTVKTLSWGTEATPCSFHTTTINLGKIHASEGTEADSTKLTAVGTEVTVNTGLFGSCVFTAGEIGTVAAGTNTLTINTVATRKTGLCPSSARWVASYTLTNHTAVNYHTN